MNKYIVEVNGFYISYFDWDSVAFTAQKESASIFYSYRSAQLLIRMFCLQDAKIIRLM